MLTTQQMNIYMKRRYKKRREQAIAFLGGKCKRCDSVAELEFHHIEPTTKLFHIARGSSFSHDRFWAEVRKCELLCRSCHSDHHYTDVD